MKISDIDDKIIDKLWKSQVFSDKFLWETFHSLDEITVRNYVKNRWFAGRDVRGNHITRKLNKFWPAIRDGVALHRAVLIQDTSYQKLYKIYNSYNNLCYVVAGSVEDAKHMSEILLPLSAGEADRTRYVMLEGVYPQTELVMHQTSGNSSIITDIETEIKVLENARDVFVVRKDAEIRKYQSRLDAIKMLTSFSGSVETDPPAEAETVAETEEVIT